MSVDPEGLETQSLVTGLNLVSVYFLRLHSQVAHKSEKLHKQVTDMTSAIVVGLKHGENKISFLELRIRDELRL